MAEYALFALIGLVTGVLSGLFGLGGGFLIVPFLAIAGWPLPAAIGTSLLYIALVGAGGAWQHFRRNNLDVRFVALFSVTSVLGAQAGAILTRQVPEWLLALAFGLLLGIVAMTMGRTKPPHEESPVPHIRTGPTLGLGGVVGVLSGLFGIGGGLIFVPAQVRLFSIPLKRAVGNSLAAVLLTGASGVLAHVWLGNVRYAPGLALVAGGIVGVMVGIRLLQRIPVGRLQAAIVVFLACMAGYMVFRGLSPFLR